MNYQGTPGQIQVVRIDPNNSRIDLEFLSAGLPGVYNQITVDAYGRVIAGQLIPAGGGGGVVPPVPPVVGTSISIVSNGTTIMSNTPALILENGINISFSLTANTLVINAPTNLRATDAGLATATIDQLSVLPALNGNTKFEVCDSLYSPASRYTTGTQIAAYVASVNGTIPSNIRVTDTGTATRTIHQLTLAYSGSLTQEFEVYDPNTTPHSLKVTGSQLKTLISPAPVYVENSAGALDIGTEGGTYVQIAGNSTWNFPSRWSCLGKIYQLVCMSPYGTDDPRTEVTFNVYDPILTGGNHNPLGLGSYYHVFGGNSITLISTTLGWRVLNIMRLPTGAIGT